MAWYPKAARRELPQNARQPRITPRSIALHTAVSNSSDLFSFFNGRSAGVESHFYVTKGGGVLQYVDTARRADCQLDGNDYAVSIETWDGAGTSVWPDWRTNGNGGPPWNADQVSALVQLMAWICRTHSIPAIRCPAWNGHGIGYHSQFTGGARRWNEHHACPGTARIRQVPGLIADVAAVLAGGAAPTVTPATTPPSEPVARFPGAAWFRTAPRHQLITAMGKRLVAEGCGRYSDGPGPQWSDADRQSYAAWQRRLGYAGADADGWPGQGSWDRLRVPNPAYKPPAPTPVPSPRKPDAEPKGPVMATPPMLLVKTADDAAVYVIDGTGRAWHVPNPTALALGRRAGYYANDGIPTVITRPELDAIRVTA